MRIIPNGSGWDIALDMVFNDKRTAFTVAQRIEYALQALIRDAVDTSMVGTRATRAQRLANRDSSTERGQTTAECAVRHTHV